MKNDKDADVEERDWVMDDENYYWERRGRDVTSMAIEQMKNPEGTQTVHSTTFDKDVSTSPNVSTTGQYVQFNVG